VLATLDLLVLQTLTHWLDVDRHIDVARCNGHRFMLVLAMDLDLAQPHVRQVQQAIGDCLWVNVANAPLERSINASQASQVLGSNRLGVIYNAHEEFNASAFSALAGTIEAGGIMVLLTPELPQWVATCDQQSLAYGQPKQGCKSWFKYWWIKQWAQHDAACLYSPQANTADKALENLISQPVGAAMLDDARLKPSLHQQQIIDRLVTAHDLQVPMIYCLNAPRGRGKSSCLGWAINALDTSLTPLPIIVTAPSKRALISMQHTAAPAQINFWALDALLLQLPAAAMLIIDEAAAVPVSQLARLATHYKLLVLSSTQDGYEGSGQGYRLKLPRLLDQLKLATTQLSLAEPMRWRPHDPLEELIVGSFLCRQISTHCKAQQLQLAGCEHRQVSAEQLTQNPELLQQVYGLLMLSHYQTSPQDLRNLLDHATHQLHVWRYEKEIVGVVWLSQEGGFDRDLAHQVELGQRRVPGHLLAQILAQQAGFGEAAGLLSWRVQRIAVDPNRQHQGLGSLMLGHISLLARQQGVDYLGASFSADAQLINFWSSNDYRAVWLGLTADAATGLNSIQFMLPLSPNADTLFASLRSHLYGYLKFAKQTWFQHLGDLPWFIAMHESLAELPQLSPAQKTRLLELVAHGSANIHAGMYILEPLLATSHEQQLLTKSPHQSKKAYQQQVRRLALQSVS